jgi:hypothetical protein
MDKGIIMSELEMPWLVAVLGIAITLLGILGSVQDLQRFFNYFDEPVDVGAIVR